MERLKLTWEQEPQRNKMAPRWTARILGVALSVDGFPAGFYWSAAVEGEDDQDDEEQRADHLYTAQLAAEAAALGLLTEAVQSMGAEVVPHAFLRRIPLYTKHGPSGSGRPGNCDDECVKCEAERLLAAARGGR